eukprot:2436645-Heterocapsa_arctica.AAC.1
MPVTSTPPRPRLSGKTERITLETNEETAARKALGITKKRMQNQIENQILAHAPPIRRTPKEKELRNKARLQQN